MFARLLVVLTALLLSKSSDALACPQDLSSLVGVRDFTTLVAGSHTGRGVGVNGYYRIAFEKKGCSLTATIVKLGFTGVRFPEEKLQYGTFPVKVYKAPGAIDRLAMFVDAKLTAENGSSLDIGFTFIGSMGFWRYLGESWSTTGFWGPLESVQTPKPRSSKFQGPDKIKCTGQALSAGGSSVGALFVCSEIAIASPDLSEVRHYHAQQEFSVEGSGSFTKLAAVGSSGNVATVGYCTVYSCDSEGCADGARDAVLLAVDSKRVTLKDASAELKKKCGLRPQKSGAGRWDGTIR